ncbi:MAG: magnesium transporter CorA family protein, partial [Anaerolineae bacterium]|nr:magnesium transporter CorA family protein [Anaerolineae bacterium]
KLHPAVVADLKREDRRPTLLVYPEYLFLSLFEPRAQLRKVLSDEIHCLVGSQFFITVRASGKSSVDSAYERAAQIPASWNQGVTYLLYLTTQGVIDAFYPLLDKVSDQLNDMEESIMVNGARIKEKDVFRIKQQLITLRQMVSPQREVLAAVIGEERLSRNVESRDLFRHLYERLLRIYDVIDSQRDLSNNVLDLLQSRESAKVADAVSRLTLLSMVFLPLTFIIGLFGLNFITTDPELRIPFSGGIVLLAIITVTMFIAAALAWYFRRRGWL